MPWCSVTLISITRATFLRWYATAFAAPFSARRRPDLAEIMLLDSAHLQQEEAEFANRHDYSKHRSTLPLYTVNDVRDCLKQLWRVTQNQRVGERSDVYRSHLRRHT